MADDHARDARIDQLEAQVAALLHAQRRPRRRFPRRFLPLALVALLVLLTPLSLLAASPFNDLTGSVHDANIGLIHDAGITTGCVPNVSYCPTANVTREEMASFLARTAGLGTNPPVVNAKTAQTATNATNATTAQNLQGYAADGLVRVARGMGFTDVTTTLRITNTYQTIAAATLTAPEAGFVLVQGAATISGGSACTTVTRLRDTAGAARTESPFAGTQTTSGAGVAFDMPVAPTWVFPVPAGGRTFVIEAVLLGGSGCYASQGMITALFVPFGAGGAATLGADAP